MMVHNNPENFVGMIYLKNIFNHKKKPFPSIIFRWISFFSHYFRIISCKQRYKILFSHLYFYIFIIFFILFIYYIFLFKLTARKHILFFVKYYYSKAMAIKIVNYSIHFLNKTLFSVCFQFSIHLESVFSIIWPSFDGLSWLGRG